MDWVQYLEVWVRLKWGGDTPIIWRGFLSLFATWFQYMTRGISRVRLVIEEEELTTNGIA